MLVPQRSAGETVFRLSYFVVLMGGASCLTNPVQFSLTSHKMSPAPAMGRANCMTSRQRRHSGDGSIEPGCFSGLESDFWFLALSSSDCILHRDRRIPSSACGVNCR